MKTMKFVTVAMLAGIGLLLGGCFQTSSHGGPRPGYGHHYAYASSGPGYGSRDRAPDCGSDGGFSARLGKCVGNETHDVELTGAQKATFTSCGRIMTRTVLKGDRLVHQQKGINCQRPN